MCFLLVDVVPYKEDTTPVCLEPDLYMYAATRCHAFRSSCDVALASPNLCIRYREPAIRKPSQLLHIYFIYFLVSRLYPTPLPRPISIQYSVTWRPTSSLSPCDTTIHLFALGPISVFVSRYTWYECAAGREKQSQNLIEKTYS